MFRIAVFILILFAIAFGFAWLADNPGTVTVQWDWLNQGQAYELGLISVVVALAVLFIAFMVLWWIVSAIINSPKSFGRWRAGRRRDKGYSALSKGLVAAGAGNAPLAKKLSKESQKLLENEPLVAMLDAQTALLEGDRAEARKKFETMLSDDETRLLGLRGLYVEAEQEGALEAAAHFAKEANTHTPGTPWAAKALLKVQTISGEWAEAQQTLEQNRSAGVLDKDEYNRKKAVILTAQAIEEENDAPENAKAHALAAHKLAPDLAPAAVIAARVSTRLNDTRKAGKVLEAAWKNTPHPEIADAYVNLKSGESAADRLKRAEKLASKKSDHVESQLMVAKAAVDAGEFAKARLAMEAALKDKPTERACLLMADIEEAEHGDRGRVREWLSRAVTAERDPAWTADGIVAEEWAPCSPVTGQLDAFEWKEPTENLGGPSISNDYSGLVNLPLEDKTVDINPVINDEPKKSEAVEAATVVTATAATTAAVQKEDDVEDAEVIPVEQEKEDADTTGDKTESTDSSDGPVLTVVSSNDDPEPPKGEKTEDVVSSDEPEKADSAEPESSLDKSAGSSPFTSKNLDPDDDGLIDHRPDDPGVKEEPEKKKGWLF